MYKVNYTKEALKQLRKIDIQQAGIILAWIEKNLVNIQNPRTLGKSLSGNMKGAWRYRVGSYRLIAHIEDKDITILILSVRHRKDVYK